MSVLELITQKVSMLSTEKQLEVLDFVEFLIHKMKSEDKANSDTFIGHSKTGFKSQH